MHVFSFDLPGRIDEELRKEQGAHQGVPGGTVVSPWGLWGRTPALRIPQAVFCLFVLGVYP